MASNVLEWIAGVTRLRPLVTRITLSRAGKQPSRCACRCLAADSLTKSDPDDPPLAASCKRLSAAGPTA